MTSQTDEWVGNTYRLSWFCTALTIYMSRSVYNVLSVVGYNMCVVETQKALTQEWSLCYFLFLTIIILITSLQSLSTWREANVYCETSQLCD